MSAERLRVVALENGRVTREGIKIGLQSAGIEVWVTGDEDGLLPLIAGVLPHVVLVDLKMGRDDADYRGLEHIRTIKGRWPETKCVAFTSFPHLMNFKRAIENRADGFVVKDNNTDLPALVKAVAEGHREFDQDLLRALAENYGTALGAESAPGVQCPLSTRELDVLRHSDGKSNKEIADAMNISENTVKTHLASVYEKLAVNDRRGALMQARLLGYLKE